MAKTQETFNEVAISQMPTTLSSLKAMVQAQKFSWESLGTYDLEGQNLYSNNSNSPLNLYCRWSLTLIWALEKRPRHPITHFGL